MFSQYTADRLWQDEYISQRMLESHLDKDAELASRPHAFIERSVEWMKSRFQIGTSTVVLDYGRGPGMYASRLAQLGATVTGIDFSGRSIQHASRDGAAKQELEITYVLDDYLNWNATQPAHLITLIFCDLCPLSPATAAEYFGKFQQSSQARRLRVFRCVLARCVRIEDGASGLRAESSCGFFSPNDYFGFQNTFKYDSDQSVTR